MSGPASLELYHWEPTVHSGEILLYLEERQLPFRSHYVDLLELEQHRPAFLQLNPTGQVPVLAHDGRVLTETGLLLQYLEDAFAGSGLTPATAAERYEVSFWIKYSAERIAPAVSLLGWRESTRPQLGAAQIAAARASLAALPIERQRIWQKALDDSYSAEEIALMRESLAFACAKLEQALAAHPFLAGDTYSVADIALFFMTRAIRGLLPDILNAAQTPKTLEWLRKLERRPAVAAVLALSRGPAPERMYAPGPELARWG
jgi:GSH-dependent disulfide-bond oxidoreductase